ELGPQQFPGRVVLVTYWATFCAPCADEMPSLERLWRQYRDRGLVVLAVSVDDRGESVRDFQGRLQLTFPMAHDPDWRAAHAWGTTKIPETYVISRRGQVRVRVMGAIDWMSADSQRMVEGLLAER